MRLNRLVIRNYRNLDLLDFRLPPDGFVLIGDNGQGKTNLLEAIYYLVLFRSLRGARDRELVRFGESTFFVAGETGVPGSAEPGFRVTAAYDASAQRKKVTLDGAEVERLGEAVGRLAAVVLSPADREIVAAGPGYRRRYLDILLSLTRAGYLSRLLDARAAVRQRNAALRRGRADEARAFDEPFAAAAAAVMAAREAWTETVAERFGELTAALGERQSPRLQYRASVPGASPERLRTALEQVRPRDLRRGMTTVGPHRDDLGLSLDGREVRTYGSAGQQRTVATALRLLEAETLRDARGAPPLALFDDAFAELDQDRQERLLALIRDVLPGQAIITAPRDAEVPGALLDRPRWRIRSGTIARP